MASTSGTKVPGEIQPLKTLSRRFSRSVTMSGEQPAEEPGVISSERVPSSLAPIVPILRVADELEEKNSRVAYLCRFYAFEMAHKLDPVSAGRGVSQFKTALLHKLQKDEEPIPNFAKVAANEIVKFYKQYYEEYVREGPVKRRPEEMAKICQIATVLYDAMKNLVPPEKIDSEIERYAKEVEKKKEHFVHYNILPLHATATAPVIMELPEIKAAVQALRNIHKLPVPDTRLSNDAMYRTTTAKKPVSDIFDWLRLVFGFQKSNAENQREHLILLLANIGARNHSHSQGEHTGLDENTVAYLMEKIFKNYRSWCDYLHRKPNIRFAVDVDRQQLHLLYMGLYLLIWGEASNIRFMPECLCYIFHNMADDVYKILNASMTAGENSRPLSKPEESFLQEIITPIYNVLREEAQKNRTGTADHSKWRNYDDLNEYFWSNRCFGDLGWPMKPTSNFFINRQHAVHTNQKDTHETQPAGKPKSNFVEVRTFWHLFRSFDRLWVFFTLALQAMMIVAWNTSGAPTALSMGELFKSVLSIFITAAVLNFFQAFLDIILSWKAWGSMSFTQILRYILKFVMAAVWLVVLPISYASSWDNPTGIVKIFSDWTSNYKSQSLFGFLVAIYLIPNLISALLFMVPLIRRFLERSNWRIVVLMLWWAQPKLYVGRGMHESIFSLLKYTLFWILLLITKLAFSYYVEIMPLIEPTKLIVAMQLVDYEWHEFFPNMKHNIGVVISIWAPIVLVYYMDAQIWVAIFSTIVGGIRGAFSHLGEIRTLGMLRSRFGAVPLEFAARLIPIYKDDSREFQLDNLRQRKDVAKFQNMWNEFISCLREEDLISNREKDLLLVPYSSTDVSVVQWPPFLLVSKIPAALDIVKDFRGKDDARLFRRIKSDDYMLYAIVECFETLQHILLDLLEENDEKEMIRSICRLVNSSMNNGTFLHEFEMSEMPQLTTKLEKFITLLQNVPEDNTTYKTQIINVLQDVVEIITQDVMINGRRILEEDNKLAHDQSAESKKFKQKFEKVNLDHIKSWSAKITRLHLLFTFKESAINVPMNLDARRRITFFANSLFMTMPRAPNIRNMMSFSVLTPYYKEDVMYSVNEFNKENEDGISTLFYLQKIYPDEWSNFIERTAVTKDEGKEIDVDHLIQWVSYRGQTLGRTVRGMMYYRRALELQCYLDTAEDHTILDGRQQTTLNAKYLEQLGAKIQAIADIKFTYVVSCQIYGMQRKSSDARDRNCYQNILNLMLNNRSLRVAYIDEREETINGKSEKVYYSVLLKGGDKLDEEIYRIKLPGNPTAIGEGKPENQNHAIIFTRGEALQTIDMNQDNYLEEAFKMRNLLEEFHKSYGRRRPTILGLREHIFTGSVSSLAWFMSNQETSFVTIGQRVLANPLKVRFHYGHPDVFDRIFHITRGGISKASKVINLSEDIFAGYNSTLRGGNVTHHEYMQVGKGRDVGMNQISIFEAKVSNGNGEQTLSRDIYRLGRRFDFYRLLSFYFTTVGFYFSSMVTVLTVYVFLYGRLYLVLSGLERAILEDPSVQQNKSLESALATQSVFQLGLLLVLPMVMEVGLEKGFRTALGEFIIMQLQLASVFYTFQLGTKAHYYGRTIMHGGAKYRSTGRGFVVFHAKFAENYRMYSRSHFVKGLELMVLLIVYQVYGSSYRSSSVYMFVTFSMWFLVASWLFAPFVFNPSGFEWQKTVDDFTDWTRWVGNRGGIGIQADRSWEAWWDEEQAHLKYTDIRGRLLEIILACRFFIYQYGIVYHLDIAHRSKSILVYGLSWLVMATVLLVLKMVSMGRRKFGTDFQLMFRILKALLFLGFVSVITVLFVVCGLTIADVFAGLLCFMPTGWAFLLIGQASKPLVRAIGLWESIKELARAYEYVMGIVIFTPIAVLSWFPFMSDFQTRLLFNQAFSRGLQISRILAGKKDKDIPSLTFSTKKD